MNTTLLVFGLVIFLSSFIFIVYFWRINKTNAIIASTCFTVLGLILWILGITLNKSPIRKKKIIIYSPPYDENIGGIMVLYYLAALLKKQHMNVKIYSTAEEPENKIFSNYTKNIDVESSIVIYPEITPDNPLNAKYVIRWILSEIGPEATSSWGKSDLCYYYLSEIKIKNNPEKINSMYKFLTFIYLKPNTFRNFNKPRKGYCHIFKKSHYHKNLVPFHPEDSIELNCSNYNEYVEKFNEYEYFICYDPACFLIFIAGLCGCIPILHKIENVSKEEYFTGNSTSNSALFVYYQHHPYTNYPGISYGNEEEEIQHAKETIHLLPSFLKKQIKFVNNYCLKNFIGDMKNFTNNINNIENNF
jgi:hypothetical protein